MAGLPYAIRPSFGLRKPKARVRGQDVAGTVVAVGASVTRWQHGVEVFGTREGSFADFVAAAEDKIALKPTNLTFDQAATVPIAGTTALQAVRDAGQVRAGQTVLIVGPTVGVGSFAVQIAKAFGASVTGVCSTGQIKGDPEPGARPSEELLTAMGRFNDELKQAGVLLDLAGLYPSGERKRVRFSGGEISVFDGPFEEKDAIAG